MVRVTTELLASLRQRAQASIDAPPVHYGFGDGGVTEMWVTVPPRGLIALVEAVEAAQELSRFLGPDGDPDLRNRVARLDVALEALDE